MANSGEYTQDVYQRRSQIAQKLLEQARGNPSRNWAEGLGNLSETALGAFQQAKADAQQKVDEYKSKKDLNEALGLPPPEPPKLGSSGASQIAGLLGSDWPSADGPQSAPQQTGFQKMAALFNGGGAAPADTPMAPGGDQASYPAPQPAPAAPTTFRPGIEASAPTGAPDYSKAIAGIESGGAYDKLGPTTKSGDRAFGKYQVMGNNVPEWTEAALGKRMTPAEFLANPDAQEAVFKQRFGSYVDKYGPEGAAKAWFAGEKGMNNPNAKDVLGTSVQGYGQKFMNALGPQGMPSEITAGQSFPPSSGPGAVFNSLDAAADIPPSSGPGAVFNSLDAAANGPPSAAPQIAQALAAPAGMPVQGAPPGGSGALANVPQETKVQIARLLSSNNPAAKAMGTALLQQAVKPPEFGFQTLQDGTIVRTNPRTGTVEPTYQAPAKKTFGVIGKDAEGKETYGFIDTANSKVTPLEQAKPGDERPTVTGPDGKEIVIPKGVDAKTFRNEISKATADAATGKKTEVQGAAEQFANRLELAEKNFQGLEKEASGAAGLAQSVAGKVPVVGTFAQSKDFQKMEQAKSQFITALLRKESGAAIGKEEFTRYDKEFFPQPGNPPEVIAQKAEARRVAIEAMKKTAGPSYKPPEMSKAAPARTTKTIGGKNYYQENGQWYEE